MKSQIAAVHRAEPIERDDPLNILLDRIEADIRAVLAAGAAYQLERRLTRILASDALGNDPTEGTRRNA